MKEFFRKPAGWHHANSSRINFFTDNFQGFSVKERLWMVTSRYLIKWLKNICEKVFYCIYWSSAGVQSKDVLIKSGKFTEKHLCRSVFFNETAGWKPETVKGSQWRCLVKQRRFLKLCKFHKKTPALEHFLNKVVILRPCQSFEKGLTKFLRTTILKNICERLSKRRPQHICFPVNFVNYSKTPRASTNGWFWNTSAGVSLQ